MISYRIQRIQRERPDLSTVAGIEAFLKNIKEDVLNVNDDNRQRVISELRWMIDRSFRELLPVGIATDILVEVDVWKITIKIGDRFNNVHEYTLDMEPSFWDKYTYQCEKALKGLYVFIDELCNKYLNDGKEG